MNEEQVSEALFLAAEKDPGVTVISWQGVDGKGYFSADVKLRLPSGRRVEPDLVIIQGALLWLIEVKGYHSGAQTDEAKLKLLLDSVPPRALLNQIAARIGRSLSNLIPCAAVAYYFDDVTAATACVPSVRHIDWSIARGIIASSGLASYLDSLMLS